MAKSWLIDGKSIARKVLGATSCSAKQIRDLGVKRECPNCHYWIDNSDVTYEWPGLPAGVKFDPSDVELLDHLAAKCRVMNAEPHMFIDEFIPTLDEDRGICYTHPKNLPGAKEDGSCIHFFHRTANAYASGPRKRRKIQSEESEEEVRWHKTGKTKPIVDMNGVQKGHKKIMVLYRCSKKGSKAMKSNWVMHQYHLGAEEDEKEGEYVVSKIRYEQQKETEKYNTVVVREEPLMAMNPTDPKTPTPNPHKPLSAGLYDDPPDQESKPIDEAPNPHKSLSAGLCDDPPDQESKPIDEASGQANTLQPEEDPKCNPIVAGESQGNHLDGIELLCKDENLEGTYGPSVLDEFDFDTPPDVSLADLHFSQESLLGWTF